MGYTHYYDQQRTVPPEQWTLICDGFRQLLVFSLLEGKTLPIQRELDNPSPAEIDEEIIAFNGIGNDGHETMVLRRQLVAFAGNAGPPSIHNFQCCKTNRKPYDLAVTALLVIADYYSPCSWEISSDGGSEGFNEALAMVLGMLPNVHNPHRIST